VKNKQTKTQLCVFLLFLIVALFYSWKNCLAEEAIPHLLINEIQASGGTGKTTEEFIELYNPTDLEINLLNYKLTKKTSAGTESNLISSSKFLGIIPSHKYFLIAHPDYSNTTFADLVYSGSSYSISSNNTVLLYDADTVLIDKVGFGATAKDFKSSPAVNPVDGKSIERKNFQDTGDNSADFSPQDKPSPINLAGKKAEESKEDLTKDTPNDYSGKLKINELFPAPKNKNEGKEFVEIRNISDEKIDLSGMRIEDEKNTNKLSFPEKILLPKEIFYLEGDFELNNTTTDSAFLIAKDGTKTRPIDFVTYEKPKYDYAYAFNGSTWQWTSKETKGAENQFDELLLGQIKKDKNIYAGVYANFEAKVNDKAKKFTWDFGDNHKSYLKNTRHKYEKAGTYQASLKITGEGEDNLLNFTVTVTKFGKAKVQIISLSPNPEGKDTENEWLEIQNNTKKKIDLKGWSVASGSKNLSNHPITKKFVLKAGETKKLTRNFCAFSLGNKKAKIELRYPNGKVADKIKYDRKDDSISKDEIYQKEGSAWKWIAPQKDEPEEQDETELEVQIENKTPRANEIPENEITKPAIEIENNDFDLSDLGKSSENPAWQKKQKNQIALLFSGSNISPNKIQAQNQGLVLGVSTVKHNQDKTTPIKSSDHFWKKINSKLNQLILFF
jgi:hypothetical protein